VVVAPYYALQELDLEALELPRRVIVFANNYLAQGYKLTGVKATLNRTVCRLLHVGRTALDTFPLLAHRKGVFMPDLGVVPEKYRLDRGRCEELLERFLAAWLEVIDGAVSAKTTNGDTKKPAGPRTRHVDLPKT
jgi:hypothetical protein